MLLDLIYTHRPRSTDTRHWLRRSRGRAGLEKAKLNILLVTVHIGEEGEGERETGREREGERLRDRVRHTETHRAGHT